MMGPISAGDATGIYGLLAALVDPKAVKERLDALMKEQKAYEKLIADLEKKTKEQAEQVEQVKNIRRGIDEKQASQSVRDKELERREDAVLAREHQLAEMVKKHNAEMDLQRRALQASEEQYAARVRQLQQDRATTDGVMRDAHEKQRVVDAKLAKLREIQTAGE
jgi:chromosome segregation ATPase